MNFLQKFFKKNEMPKLTSMGSVLSINDEFADACIVREMTAIAEDIIQPYIFENEFIDNVYEYNIRQIYQKSVTIKDILVSAMLANDLVISKVLVKNELSQKEMLFTGQPDMLERDLKKIYGGDFRILQSAFFEKIYTETDLQLLRLCYRALGFAYNRQDRVNKIDAKSIFKMKGFHALFTEPKTDEELGVAEENRRQVIQNFKDILEGDAGIIDAEDSVGLLGGSTSSASNVNFQQNIDLIFSEIARILRVPITRLLGRAPQGMNATGESDSLNYDMTLDTRRSGWVEPFLKIMQIPYTKVDKIDISYIKQIMELHVLLEIEPSEKMKEKIKKLGEDL